MKFQVIRKFSVTVNGRRTEYNVGQRISEAAYRRLSSSQQRNYFLSARSAASRNPYTRPELEFIVSSYLNNDNPYNVRAEFIEQFPNTPHTAESVRAVAGQLRSLDNNYPLDTQWDVKSLVREVAEELCPERFVECVESKLDALLADIRG